MLRAFLENSEKALTVFVVGAVGLMTLGLLVAAAAIFLLK